MTNRSTAPSLAWLLLAATLVATLPWVRTPAAAGTEATADSVRKSVDAVVDGVVQIDHPTGTLVVSGWDRPTVEITGRVGRGVESALVERRGERVLVRMDQSLQRGQAADLDVRVPAGSRLEVHGMSLDVRISGVAGEIDARVVSGTLRVTGGPDGLVGRPGNGVPEPVRLETVSGVIQADGTFGALELSAVSGPIRVDGAVRSLTTESGNGPQDLKLHGARRVEDDSLNGPIHLDLIEPAPGASVTGKTFNGVLQLGLAAGAEAQVDARARYGRVENRLGGDEQRRTEEGYPASVTIRLGPETPGGGAVGGGAVRIRLSTHRGDIVLRPLR